MAENGNRGKRGWLRRGTAKAEPMSRPDLPGVATGSGSATRPPVDDPTRAGAFGDPWSADAWSDEGWDDGWNDRTRRARVRPAAEPRSADVDAWLESDQTQFADMTADMARKWKAKVPDAVGSTWDADAPDAGVRNLDDTDAAAQASSPWAPETQDRFVDEPDAGAASVDEEPDATEAADEYLPTDRPGPEIAVDAEAHVIAPSEHDRADVELQADRVATPLGSVVPVLGPSGISWGSATSVSPTELTAQIEVSSDDPYEEADEEARIDALLAEAEGNANQDDFDRQIPPETQVDVTDEDATPAPPLHDLIESASAASDAAGTAEHVDGSIVPAVAELPRPGSTWDDDEIEQQIDHLLAEPSLDTALDEHVDDAFVTDVDRTIERDLVAEFGREDDGSILLPAHATPKLTASTPSRRPPITADLQPPANGDQRPATAHAPQASSTPPHVLARTPASAAPIVQATKPNPAMIPAATGHLVGLFLVSGLGLATAAVLRLSVITAGAARQERGSANNAVSLTDRLGNAASGLGTLHGLLLLSAIVCAVLAAAAGRGRSRRDERLAGWICGAALAAGLGGLAAAGLGIKFVTDNGSSFSQVAGDLADLIGLAVTSLAAMWGGWRASDPNL